MYKSIHHHAYVYNFFLHEIFFYATFIWEYIEKRSTRDIYSVVKNHCREKRG